MLHECRQRPYLLALDELEDRRLLNSSSVLSALLTPVVAPVQALVVQVAPVVPAVRTPVQTLLAPAASVLTPVEKTVAEAAPTQTATAKLSDSVAKASPLSASKVSLAPEERRAAVESTETSVKTTAPRHLRIADVEREAPARVESLDHDRPSEEPTDAERADPNKNEAQQRPEERKEHRRGPVEELRLLEEHETVHGPSGTEHEAKAHAGPASAPAAGKRRKPDDELALAGPSGTQREDGAETATSPRTVRRPGRDSHGAFRLVPLESGPLDSFAPFDPEQVVDGVKRLLAQLDQLRGEMRDWLAGHGGTTTWLTVAAALTAAELLRRRKTRAEEAGEPKCDETYLAGTAPVA